MQPPMTARKQPIAMLAADACTGVFSTAASVPFTMEPLTMFMGGSNGMKMGPLTVEDRLVAN